MTRFRTLVADDEPLARTMVAALLRADPDVESVFECGDAACTRDSIARLRPDIVFLDIEMPGSSGLQIADALDARGPIVVFITAFSGYATQAFDVSAVDYVLKPFSDQRFAEAVERAKRRVRERRLGELATQVASLSAELRHNENGLRSRTASELSSSRLPRSCGSRLKTITSSFIQNRAATWCAHPWHRSSSASTPIASAAYIAPQLSTSTRCGRCRIGVGCA
jgi:DNA-binding LytR/AlgR family response regulator